MSPTSIGSMPSGVMDPTTAGLLSQLYPGQQAAQVTPTPTPIPQSQPQQNKGNFLTRLLPFGGSVAGGAGGAALGTAVLPGIGTVLGGILGAMAGGGGAKAAENVVEGDTNVGQGVGREAIESGIGQAAGGLLGKLGGIVLNKGANILGGVSNKLIQGQAAKGALDTATANTLRTGGVTSLDQASKIADVVTGKNGVLNQGVEKALMKSGQGVDVTGLIGSRLSPNGLADDLIGNETALGGNAGQKILQTVNKSVQNMLGGPEGKIGNQLADPLDVLKQSRVFGKLAADARTLAAKSGNAEQQAVANVYQGLSDELGNRIFSSSAMSAVPDNVRAEILQKLAPLKDINPTAYNNLVQGVSNAKTLSDLRSLQAPYVGASKAVATTARADSAAGGSSAGGVIKSAMPVVGSMAAGPLGMAAGALPMVVGSSAADRAGAAITNKLAQAGLSKGAANAVTPVLTGASQFIAHSPNYVPPVSSSNLVNTSGANIMNNPAVGGHGAAATSPNQQLLMSALIGMQNPYMASTFAPIVQSLLSGPIQKSTSAESALNSAEQAFNQAGGGQGLVGGLLGKLGGTLTGGPAHAYAAQRAQLIAQLNSLGVPTSAVPDLTNTGPAAQQEFQSLRNLIASMGGPGLLGAVPATL